MNNGMTMRSKWLVVAMLSGCATEGSIGTVVQGVGEQCPINLCGNSNELMHDGVSEASLVDEYDANGIKIYAENGRAQLFKNGIRYELHAKQSQIFGVHPTEPVLEHKDLIGAEILLMRNGAPLNYLHISDVRKIAYPIGPPGSLESYTLTRRGINEPVARDPACNGVRIIDPSTKRYYVEFLGMLPGETLIFEGDHFDIQNKLVRENPARPDGAWPDWITFGCAGHTFAKMNLLREVRASQPVRNWETSQATLKMLVADYCGNSVSLTVPGQPLVWIGGQLDHYLTTPTQLEARWNENGATCYGTPRLIYHPPPPSPWVPNVLAGLALCPLLQPCMNPNMDELDGALLVSANWDP